MALYIGSSKKQVIKIFGQKFRLNIYFANRIINGVLKSSDGFLLKDSNDLYLTVKEDN